MKTTKIFNESLKTHITFHFPCIITKNNKDYMLGSNINPKLHFTKEKVTPLHSHLVKVILSVLRTFPASLMLFSHVVYANSNVSYTELQSLLLCCLQTPFLKY